jgi:hypothetical protein
MQKIFLFQAKFSLVDQMAEGTHVFRDMNPRWTVFFAHAAQQTGKNLLDIGAERVFKPEHDLAEQFAGKYFVSQRAERHACTTVKACPSIETLCFLQAGRKFR